LKIGTIVKIVGGTEEDPIECESLVQVRGTPVLPPGSKHVVVGTHQDGRPVLGCSFGWVAVNLSDITEVSCEV
jgi:hypothetical protein